MQGECPAYRQNYADLDPTYHDAWGNPLLRVTFDYTDNERKMVKYVAEKALTQIIGQMNPSIQQVGDTITTFNSVPYQSTHINGGTLMGDDPSTSVVNKYGQVWGVPNLFVIGRAISHRTAGTTLRGRSAHWPTTPLMQWSPGTYPAQACWPDIRRQWFMQARAVFLFLGTLAVIVATACGNPAAASPPPSPTQAPASAGVNMTDANQFQPVTLSVSAGTTVTWMNTGSVQHTVTDDPSKAVNAADATVPAGAQA